MSCGRFLILDTVNDEDSEMHRDGVDNLFPVPVAYYQLLLEYSSLHLAAQPPHFGDNSAPFTLYNPLSHHLWSQPFQSYFGHEKSRT